MILAVASTPPLNTLRSSRGSTVTSLLPKLRATLNSLRQTGEKTAATAILLDTVQH